MGKAMQDQMDMKTQNSQIYIGTPNGIVLCMDAGSGRFLRGRPSCGEKRCRQEDK